MATTEHSINDALAEVLRTTRRAWQSAHAISAEKTGMLKGSNKRPDILVIEPHVSPVVIETEISPAATVEAEARSRLGEELRKTGRRIMSAIAIRMPSSVTEFQGQTLRDHLANSDLFEMVLYTGKSEAEAVRWPMKGWITGKVGDLSILTQSASIPPDLIEEAANQLVVGVREAAGIIADLAATHPASIGKISEHLRQEDGEQTRRMAATILTDAFLFHENLAGGPGELGTVKSVDELRSEDSVLRKSDVLNEWRKILKVNYWPIFDISRRILESVPAPNSAPLLDALASTASRLLENRLMRSHDLTGAVFQRLIADRKFLAAYYTTPASASLLVGLAIPSEGLPGGGEWDNAEALKKFRIADFACGTGTLLSTAYRRIGQLHELAGGDIEELHPDMMAHTITGCDVLPAATHLTASMLSGAHPTKKYEHSSVLTVAYGKQEDGEIALGSLDLLDPQRKLEILAITAKSVDAMGETEKEIWASLPHAAFHAVIMNPPFTRATSHEGKKSNVPNPVFAAFGADKKSQTAMAKRLKEVTQDTAYHGNAGEASAFVAMGDKKLVEGGILALVLPLSLQAGGGWEKVRKLLRTGYNKLCVVNIAAERDNEASFSADTGMAECLVIGRKGSGGAGRALFVTLSHRPTSQLEGRLIARQISQRWESNDLRKLEDGPVGGEMIRIGDDYLGAFLDGPLPAAGTWPISRVADMAIAQTSFQLVSGGRLWLPSVPESDAISIPVCPLSKLAEVGPLHRDINGTERAGSVIRGPFDIEPIPEGQHPTYPALWAHSADKERRILVEPDTHGIIRAVSDVEANQVIESRAAKIWATASHVHFNYDFRFNSQSTAACYTDTRSIGGRAWPSIKFCDPAHQKVFVLWANSIIGVLVHWWQANKTQSGRGTITLTAIPDLPIYDFSALTLTQLNRADAIFEEWKTKPLRPINEILFDDERRLLDEELMVGVFGFPDALMDPDGPIGLLRHKLAAEPSISGGKGKLKH